MTGGLGNVGYDAFQLSDMGRRWGEQASQMRTTMDSLSNASTSGLPPSASAAATSFLTLWENTARRASAAADVYADELEATGVSYKSFDDEIAQRMKTLGGEG